MAAKVNKDIKLSSVMVQGETLYSIIFFMTTGPCVISAGAARETLFEGKADYCMIECEQYMLISSVNILLLPQTSRLGGSKCSTRDIARKLHLRSLICALRDISQLVANHESTRPRATLELCFRRPPRGSYNSLPNLTNFALLLSRQSPSGDAVEKHCL